MTLRDKNGKPISLDEYQKLYTEIYSRVALTEFDDGSYISTVWLGADQQYGDGPPILFETMIFSEIEELDQSCWRYSTEAEAIIGHENAVLDWMNNNETSRTDL